MKSPVQPHGKVDRKQTEVRYGHYDQFQILPPSPFSAPLWKWTATSTMTWPNGGASRTPKRPRVGVLGSAPGGRQRPGPHRSPGRFTEMSVYLGLHKEVDADKLVTDLWPEDATSNPCRGGRTSPASELGWESTRTAANTCRRPGTSRIDLPDCWTSNLFRRLRKRADARAAAGDPVGAQRDLLAALTLIRGPVLSETTRDAYAWLATSDPAGVQHAPLMVIAAAHQLVEIAMKKAIWIWRGWPRTSGIGSTRPRSTIVRPDQDLAPCR